MTTQLIQLEDGTLMEVEAAWQELNKEMTIAETQIELGLSFEGEGNVYVTKATAGANLTITMTLKPPESVDENTV